MKFNKLLSIILLIAIIATAMVMMAACDENISDEPTSDITIEKLTERSYMVTFAPIGSDNLHGYIINADKNIYVIDTGCGSEEGKFVRNFIEKNLPDKPIKLINTHYHWDHAWGNSAFSDCEFLTHSLTQNIWEEKWDTMLSRNSRYLKGTCDFVAPIMTFDGTIEDISNNIIIFSCKGHTTDSICVFDKIDSYLYAGDNIGDRPNMPLPQLEISKKEYKDSLLAMKALNPMLILSGHNEPQTINFLDKIEDTLNLN